jgi:hypothetical protein
MAANRSLIRLGATGALVLALAGCASAVVVESEFPAPLVESLPVSVGIFYEPELRNFIHAEALPRSSTWTIDLGDANVAMLDPLFGAMFDSTRELSSLPPTPEETDNIDGVLTSTLEDFQFDVPRSSRDEFVEVWLQYKLELLDGQNLVITWLATGYGKAEIDGNREDAVHRAAIVAMREAGAKISTKFPEEQAVINWLRTKQNAS